jgi:hypothetical protein
VEAGLPKRAKTVRYGRIGDAEPADLRTAAGEEVAPHLGDAHRAELGMESKVMTRGMLGEPTEYGTRVAK